MNTLVRKAHEDLDHDLHQLGLAYRRTMQDAATAYEKGVLDAQLRFETALKEAMIEMIKTMQDSVGT